MTGVVKLTGATSCLGSHWKTIEWKKVKAEAKRLQVRIAKAVRALVKHCSNITVEC